LSLPREIGKSAEDGEPIIAGIGRFGSYVKHGKTYANLEPGDDVLNIGLNRAVTLIAEKRANPGKGRRFGADPGKLLGEHPQKGGPVTVKNGRYGPYVTNNGVNATLPSDKTPDTITLDEAIVLLDARAERTGGTTSRRKRPPRKEAATKAAAPKAPAKSKKRAAAAGSKPKAPRKAKAEAAE
jgi:DNA topoisomerase-1